MKSVPKSSCSITPASMRLQWLVVLSVNIDSLVILIYDGIYADGYFRICTCLNTIYNIKQTVRMYVCLSQELQTLSGSDLKFAHVIL